MPMGKLELARHSQWKEHQKIVENYQTLEKLFSLSSERSSIMKYELFVSMLEVYNEKIRDLLVDNFSEPAKKLEVKQSAEGTQEVPGLIEARVYGTDEVWEFLQSSSLEVELDLLDQLMLMNSVVTHTACCG
nr:kinesin-like protein KIFC3 [Ipomoea batatas]